MALRPSARLQKERPIPNWDAKPLTEKKMSETRAGPVTSATQGWMSSDIRIVREYPHSRANVWRAITNPALIALWGCAQRGSRPSWERDSS